MVRGTKTSKKILKLLHKFNRYSSHEKWFVVYLLVLLFCLISLPVVKVSSLRSVGGYNVWLISGEYFKTMVIILTSMIILIGWNLSFKFKNILLSYFGSSDQGPLINFIFLFIITTSFFAITDTISVASGVTSRIMVSRGGKFIQLMLLIGIILTLISLIKSVKEVGRKTKIINIVDDDYKREEQNKSDIKKGLFE